MKTKIIFTIDTEYSTHKDDLGLTGSVDGKEYGIKLFSDCFGEYGYKGTFFVDVYTKRTQYIPQLKEIGKRLIDSGHDLQLHTHPDGTFDPKRGMMRHYTPQEQKAVIKKGVELFEEFFSVKPIAHRAGDWGANHQTLEALAENGIKVDSSMFYGWKNCHLNNPVLTQNKIVEAQGIVEIPASVFECRPLGLFEPYRLLSTDGNSLAETWKIIKTMQVLGLGVINLVYHSFSFITWTKDRTNYKADHNRIKKFKGLLLNISKDGSFEVGTIVDVYHDYLKDKARYNTQDMIVKTGLTDTLVRGVDRVMSWY